MALFVVAFSGILGFAGCSRNLPPAAAPAPPIPPPPPPVVDPFDTAENAYERGLLVAAANAYNAAVEPDSPTSVTNREAALARLAMIHAMPHSPLHNLDAARDRLDDLEQHFPESRLGAPAEAMILLQAQIADLENLIGEMELSLAAVHSMVGELETAKLEQSATIHGLEGEVTRLEAALNETKNELETLRQIDRQLRQRN